MTLQNKITQRIEFHVHKGKGEFREEKEFTNNMSLNTTVCYERLSS